jgi:hypothetical protein
MILSILHTAHPIGFQPKWVRSSRRCYPSFNLAMRSSRGFASTAPDYDALFRLAFASATRQSRLTWPVTVSRRIIMQKARRHPGTTLRRTLLAVSRSRHRSQDDDPARDRACPQRKQCMAEGCLDGLRPLVGMWFQVHYPPLIGVLPTFRSRYLVRYRSPGST